MKHALLTAAIALAAVLSADAQDAVQSVEGRLDALGGDWATSDCGGRPDLTAATAGQALEFAWTDASGLSEVELCVLINWRHHGASPCDLQLNGESLGALDQPRIQFPCVEGKHYPTVHRIVVPAGVYRANAVNEIRLVKTGDEGAVGVCDAGERPALRVEIRRAPEAEREVRDQIVERSLEDLGGDWDRTENELFADTPGRQVRVSFQDETGFAAAAIHLEIFWSRHKGETCAVSMNGTDLGRLDQPGATLEAHENVFYPTGHLLHVPAGVYRAGGLNELVLTFVDQDGGFAGICEAPGLDVAMRLTIQEGGAEAAPLPPPARPMIPQGIVLVDLATGMVLAPGVVLQSPNLQIMAILADADGDYSAIEIEVRRMEAGFTGQPFIQSLPVAAGGQVIVVLLALGPGTWMIQVRAVDQRGSTSDWVQLSTGIEVVESTSGGGAGAVVRYTGVDVTKLVLPPDFGDQAGRGGGSSSGGSCSAGAEAGRGALLLLAGVMILIGVRRRIA